MWVIENKVKASIKTISDTALAVGKLAIFQDSGRINSKKKRAME